MSDYPVLCRKWQQKVEELEDEIQRLRWYEETMELANSLFGPAIREERELADRLAKALLQASDGGYYTPDQRAEWFWAIRDWKEARTVCSDE